MINWLWLAIVGKIGISFAVSGAMIAAWFFLPEIPWLTEKLRQVLLIAGISIAASTIAYTWGVYDEHAQYKAKIERQKDEAVATGDQGRADALRKLDADKLPDDWWRD